MHAAQLLRRAEPNAEQLTKESLPSGDPVAARLAVTCSALLAKKLTNAGRSEVVVVAMLAARLVARGTVAARLAIAVGKWPGRAAVKALR